MNRSSVKQPVKMRLTQGVFLLLLMVFTWWYQQQPTISSELDKAILQQHSEVMVEFKAQVVKLLPDDNKGSRHQKLIVKSNLHTILIAHNIDLAPRVPVSVEDELVIRGEYEWNDKGGVIHWTHHDPQNRRLGGWIELNGKKFK